MFMTPPQTIYRQQQPSRLGPLFQTPSVNGFRSLRIFDFVAGDNQWPSQLFELCPLFQLTRVTFDPVLPKPSIPNGGPSYPTDALSRRYLLADRARALRLWGHRSDTYRDANRRARAAFRADKRRHIGHRVSQQGRGSVWRCARDVVGGKRATAAILPTVTAESMNDFFVQVGPRVAAELAAQGPTPSLPPSAIAQSGCLRISPPSNQCQHPS